MGDGERGRCRTIGIVPIDYPDPVASDWPDLLEIVERKVKPEREQQKRDSIRHRWWQFADKRPGLRAAVARLDVIHLLSRVPTQHGIAKVSARNTCAESTVVFPSDAEWLFAILQSRPHELWAAFFSSSLKTDLRYSPSDCFENFPFPNLTACMIR